MPQTPSPLRYPGGKTSIWKMVSTIIKDNHLERGHYCEPYAGGGRGWPYHYFLKVMFMNFI